MKYLGKRLLLSGVILAMVGGSVAGVPDSVGATTKAKTELTKKTPATKKAPKKVDYAQVRKLYADELKYDAEYVRDFRKASNTYVTYINKIVTYETTETKQVKKNFLDIHEELVAMLGASDKKIKLLSKKINSVNTLKEKEEMDREIKLLDKDISNLSRKHLDLHLCYGVYHSTVFDVLYISEVAFKKMYPESINDNGIPTEFNEMIYAYADAELLKKGRAYANKKLAEGYSQERIVSWYLNEFEELVDHRDDSTYIDLLKLDPSIVRKFEIPLYERKLDVANSNMGSYNSYVDGLKMRIDGMIQRDLKKVEIL